MSGAAGATGLGGGADCPHQGVPHASASRAGKEKCRWLVEKARFDAAVDYKSEDVEARLRELCPKGIDVYFDNVGMPLLEAGIANLAMHGRVVICGAIAQYNDSEPSPGPKNYLNLLIKRSRMEGFLVSDFMKRAPEAVAALAGWVASGELVDRVDVREGLENAPQTLQRLFRGENTGKQLLKIAEV